MSYHSDQLSQMMAWEDGTLSHAETVTLFQALVDNGMAWSLQGMYGREAMRLIRAGEVFPRKGGV